jgi:hypothetical protein
MPVLRFDLGKLCTRKSILTQVNRELNAAEGVLGVDIVAVLL